MSKTNSEKEFEDIIREAFGLEPWRPDKRWHGTDKSDEQADKDAIAMILNAHQKAVTAAFKRGRIAEAKICAEAQRHDRKEAIRKAEVEVRRRAGRPR